MTPSVLSRTRNARGRFGEVRVGIITSQAEVIARVRQYVVDHSTKHDLSAASWREVWVNRFGSPEASINLGGIASFLDDADACATLAGGCDGTAAKFFDAFNQKLGKAGDNGWATLPEMLQFLDVEDDSAPFLLVPGVVPQKGGGDLMVAPSVAPSRTSPALLLAPPRTTPAPAVIRPSEESSGGGTAVLLGMSAAAIVLLILAKG